MLYLIIFIACALCALGMGVLSGWSDFRGLTIPNLYPAIIAGLFIPAAFAVHMADVPLFSQTRWHLAAGGAVFVLTFILFQLGAMGGGDSKLLTAYALWAGLAGLPSLLLLMAVSGFLLGVFALAVQKTRPFKAVSAQGWIGRLQEGENKVPYGIPITIGALFAFERQGYLEVESWKAFLL